MSVCVCGGGGGGDMSHVTDSHSLCCYIALEYLCEGALV